MGIPHKERNGKERVWECGERGVFRMEADREPKTRRGGMNINNILCWKIVTMDIIERRREAMGRKFHSWPYFMCMCVCVCLQVHTSRLSVCVHA